MQEAEEQDTCRICSAPAEENQPLFHPCKCSGTIRYIHQDCLTTWLAHSNKKSCDVCKHPYSFTKVYAPDMPTTLPPVLVVRRLIQQLFLGLLFVLRGIMVGTIWLAVLPYATVRTWRMYFFMGDSAAWWISNLPQPALNETATSFQITSAQTPDIPASTVLGRLSAHPVWVALSADIFMGQIIASLIVLTFVAVFLLREWISQNARPGVFEDEELPPPEPNRAQPQPGQRLVRVPVDQQELQEALARRQVEAMRALDEMRARDGVHGHLVGDARIHGRTPLERYSRRRGRGREGTEDASGSDPRSRRLLRTATPDGQEGPEDSEEERNRKRSFSRRIFAARVAGARRKASLAATGQPPVLPAPSRNPQFEFTFKPPEPSNPFKDLAPSTSQAPDLSSILPPAAFPLPRETIPFSLNQPSLSTALAASTPALPSSSHASRSIRPNYRAPLSVTTSEPSLPLPPPYSEDDMMPPPTATPASPTALNDVLEPRPTSRFSFTLSDAEAGPSNLPPSDEPSGLSASQNGKRKAEAVDDDVDYDVEETMSDFFTSDSEQDWKPENEVKEEEAEVAREANGNLSRPTSSDEEDEEEEHDEVDREEHVDRDDGDDDSEDDDDEADDQPWQPIEVRAGGGENGAGGQAVNLAPAVAGGQVPPAAAEVGLAGAQDDLEGNGEDDMEGAMEAIGMRGPIHGVLQNAALMIFVLDTAIGLGIFVPFTIGKITALLSLNPPRFLQILHLPIKAIRIVTDPIVDGIAYVLANILFPYLLRATKSLTGSLFDQGFSFFDKAATEPLPAESATNFVTAFTSRIADFAAASYERLSSWTLPNAAPEPQSDDVFGFLFTSPAWEKAEPHFARLGMHVRLYSMQFRLFWMKMSIGSGPAEQTFAILLGYAVVGLILAIYLNLLTVGNAKSANRAIRSAVRQQLLVLKVAAFIFIELVTFPLTCGIVLDLCTVWFFPNTPLKARVGFFKQAPLTAVFYHWVAGTMFMYTFAVVLSGCRSVMRVGAMWFIKDPQDQNSHPIRDILDRPTFTQLRKISVSGVMYGVVVACFVGSMSVLLSLGRMSILPFRWKNREPLSHVPVDLLFLHMVLPYTMQYFRPKKPMRKYATFVWKWLASRLRLSSYFFGDRHADEEKATAWWRVISPARAATTECDGSFRRVPATDNIALPRDMRATAEVNVYGLPLNEEARMLIQRQDAEVLKAKRRIMDEFTVVYFPPHFRYRILAMIACLWVVGVAVLGAAIALPIQLGRSFFAMFTSRQLHDGYSLIMGFYIAWAAYLVVAWIDRLDKRSKRSDGHRPADLPLLVAKRGLAWAAKVSYMGFWLGAVIPTLIALAVDLYMIIPFRIYLQPDWVPTVRVVDTWALGLLYAKIAMHVGRIQRPAPARNDQRQQDRIQQVPNMISEGIQHILQNGWTNPDPVQASKEVIGPIVGGLLGMVILPGAIFRAVQYFAPHIQVENRFIFIHVYPSIFALAGLVRSAILLESKAASWSQSIRDKEFLVEMRLRNHEPEKDRSSNASEESLRTDNSATDNDH